MRLTTLAGFIVTATDDGKSVPLNARILAKVDTEAGAQVLIKAVHEREAMVKVIKNLCKSWNVSDDAMDDAIGEARELVPEAFQ